MNAIYFDENGNEIVQFKKPAGDYYRLDVVKRKTVKTDRGYTVMIEDIETDYRGFIEEMREKNESACQYIHRLIEKEMDRVRTENKRGEVNE